MVLKRDNKGRCPLGGSKTLSPVLRGGYIFSETRGVSTLRPKAARSRDLPLRMFLAASLRPAEQMDEEAVEEANRKCCSC